MQQCIMHIDMDAFFASVEQLENPDLKGKPVIVGHEHRGVVAAASYEARAFGVHSAMPTFKAKKLCPQGIFVQPKHGRYSHYSRLVIDIFRNFSPVVEQASIDEAYIDATGLEGLFGPPELLGQAIKNAVLQGTGLSCSVGIAPVKFLAKIASDLKKPNGLTIILPQDVPAFLHNLPIGRIPGVGPRTKEVLTLLGVKTAGDVLNLPPQVLERRLGKMGEVILKRAQGLDDSKVEPYNAPKSEGREHTLDEDTKDKELLKKYLLNQSERVMGKVRKMGTAGRTVTLKVKFSDFQQITRSHTLDLHTTSTRLVYGTACALLDKLVLPMPVRLIGVTLSNFAWHESDYTGASTSLLPGLEAFLEQNNELADTNPKLNPHAGLNLPKLNTQKEKALDSAIDKMRELYGRNVLKRANLIEDEKK